MEGSHAIVGADLARKYGEHADVVHAIEAHHNEVEIRHREAVLVQAADAISGSRPGARRGASKRTFSGSSGSKRSPGAEGVDKVFAMQAGRKFGSWWHPMSSTTSRRKLWPGHRQADRGGADLPRPDQGDRRPGNPEQPKPLARPDPAPLAHRPERLRAHDRLQLGSRLGPRRRVCNRRSR